MNKVSLLVTTYNVKDNLAVTLESIEAQDYADIEVVIVDGRSADGMVDVEMNVLPGCGKENIR